MPASAAEIAVYKDELYEQCLGDADKIYYQHDFQAMDVIPNGDANDLMRVIQTLINEKCFKMLQDHNGIGYKCRSPEEVKIHQSLSDDEAMVYTFIEEAGSDGIWTKKIKTATKLHDAVIRAIFKKLEKKKLIHDFKTMEHPGKTFYIKASIQPNERATGGAWFTDNELDEELIEQLAGLLARFIEKRSFANKVSKRVMKTQIKHIEDIKAIRDKAFTSQNQKQKQKQTQVEISRSRSRETETETNLTLQNDTTYPFPTTHTTYPTLHDCTLMILENKVTHITLTAEDIQQLLDVLCWDGRIEKINGVGETGVAYKAVRKSNDELADGGPSNGFTEAPCGRCPVFDLCEEGGPVGPSNCEYFTQWLDF